MFQLVTASAEDKYKWEIAYRQNNLFCCIHRAWRIVSSAPKRPSRSHTSASAKRKSPNTPNGVRTFVYPTREINTVKFSDACHDPTQKGTKDLKCIAGRVHNPGSQCVRVLNPRDNG